MYNLDDPLERSKFIYSLNADIEAYCSSLDGGHRNHLGASIIGHDCQAYSWNTFRWLKREKFSGRMQRLFNRGHEEEARFIRWLKGARFTIHEIDPQTNKQFRISGCKGHFGGSLDSVGYRDDCGYLLVEFKTHNSKSFADLTKRKIILSKPKHYRQMCSYGKAYNLKHALYCAVEKDTDELHFEVVPLDYNQADDLFRKADGIIFRQNQPQKIAQVETYHECKYCNFKGICHKEEPPEVNCRSCINAFPVDNGEWHCHKYNSIIPQDFISKACPSYTRII